MHACMVPHMYVSAYVIVKQQLRTRCWCLVRVQAARINIAMYRMLVQVLGWVTIRFVTHLAPAQAQ